MLAYIPYMDPMGITLLVDSEARTIHLKSPYVRKRPSRLCPWICLAQVPG